MQKLSRRLFSTNPRAFLSVANGDHQVGKLVFELHPSGGSCMESFAALCNGTADEGRSYVGTSFTQGMSGLGVRGGKTCDENYGAFGHFNADGDTSVRHSKRGILSAVTHGDQSNGSEFTLTFNETPYLDGYQTVFGEMVEGEEVLAAMESASDRHGKLAGDFKIVDAGML